MPQQLLYHLEFRTHASQQSRIRMAKRVPSAAFLDTNSLRNRSNMLAQDRLYPVGHPSPVTPAGKDPIVWLRVGTLFSPL
jgi:hypothetical protein